jgi:hypothetical protein
VSLKQAFVVVIDKNELNPFSHSIKQNWTTEQPVEEWMNEWTTKRQTEKKIFNGLQFFFSIFLNNMYSSFIYNSTSHWLIRFPHRLWFSKLASCVAFHFNANKSHEKCMKSVYNQLLLLIGWELSWERRMKNDGNYEKINYVAFKDFTIKWNLN